MFSSSLAKVNVPVKAQEPYVKVYVDQPLGYIPGEPVDQRFTVDIIINVSGISYQSPEGIVGWGIYVQVYPDVLNITQAKGALLGYFLYDFADDETLPYPGLNTFFNATAGYGDVSEFIAPTPSYGADDWYSGLKLVTLEFLSKSETEYSKIDLFGIEYMTPDGRWHAVDEVIDGHYNEPVYYNLTVESTPIDGITFTIGSTDYATNQSVILPEGNHTVTMPSVWTVDNDTYIFRHLRRSGGNFTSSETIIPLLSNETITAIYELVLAPVASFTFLPAEPTVGETVTFNASASNDPDGTIINYDWDFDWPYASDSGVIVEHAFTVARTYYVTLTVTDNDGLSYTVEKVITVKEAPPSGIPLELYLITVAVIAIIIIAIAFYYVRVKRRTRILPKKIR